MIKCWEAEFSRVTAAGRSLPDPAGVGKDNLIPPRFYENEECMRGVRGLTGDIVCLP